MPNAYFLFFEDHLLLVKENDAYQLPNEKIFADLMPNHTPFLSINPRYAYARLLSSDTQGIGELISLRQAYPHLGDDLFRHASRAKQLLEWREDHHYCGRCGHNTDFFDDDRAKKCPACGLINYPRISPCIMVAITRGDEILLARSPYFQTKVFSILAGFIEPGESAESCVHREVFEEVSLKIKNVRFFGSQPWPFPNQLMLGFLAEYESGEILIDEKEISEARWFKYDALPRLPSEYSLSYQLILASQKNAFNPNRISPTKF